MAYHITWEKNGTVLNFRGKLSIQEINQANWTLHSDARIDHHKYSIWFLLEADLSSITKTDILNAAAMNRVASTYLHSMKVALIAQEIHAVEICNYYIESTKKDDSTWEFGLFDSIESAIEWVGFNSIFKVDG